MVSGAQLEIDLIIQMGEPPIIKNYTWRHEIVVKE